MARELLERATPETAGLWPRAAALLARQALEMAPREYWKERLSGMADLPFRPQLVCLRSVMKPASAAVEMGHAWAALSRACHHHPYELAAGGEELAGWLSAVGRSLEEMT
jgi:hypothetical protein